MTRRTRQGVGTWLALFAMLMIYVGPLVSQSMPMDHAMPMSMPMDHAMPMEHGVAMDHGKTMPHDMAGMEDMHCSDGQRAAGHHAAPVSHGEQPLTADAFMEKCGYCSLLIHSPPLTPPPVVLDHGLPAVGAPVALFVSSRILASPVFPGARSRAPPSLIG